MPQGAKNLPKTRRFQQLAFNMLRDLAEMKQLATQLQNNRFQVVAGGHPWEFTDEQAQALGFSYASDMQSFFVDLADQVLNEDYNDKPWELMVRVSNNYGLV